MIFAATVGDLEHMLVGDRLQFGLGQLVEDGAFRGHRPFDRATCAR
jgi:hypothetical protein